MFWWTALQNEFVYFLTWLNLTDIHVPLELVRQVRAVLTPFSTWMRVANTSQVLWQNWQNRGDCKEKYKPLILQEQSVSSSHQLCVVLQYLRLHRDAGLFPLHLPSWKWTSLRNSYPPKILFDEQPIRKCSVSRLFNNLIHGLYSTIIHMLEKLKYANVIPGNTHCTLEHIAWKLDGL